jgi:predicted nucleic acid-binding protein
MEDYMKYNEDYIKISEFIVKESLKRKYILDSSVIIKWYYSTNEEDLEKASYFYNNSIQKSNIIIAPDLLIYEILNFFKNKLEITEDNMFTILNEIYNTVTILGISSNLFKKAFKIARDIGVTIYDGIYISLSDELNIPFITADKKLHSLTKKLNSKIILLTDFIPEY